MKLFTWTTILSMLLVVSFFARAEEVRRDRQILAVDRYVRGIWEPLAADSGHVVFVKVQLRERLKQQNLDLLEGSIIVKPNLAMAPLNITRSVINVEYQWYANLKTYDVQFKAVDPHGKKMTGYTYLNQVNCDLHKKQIDCDALANLKDYGVIPAKRKVVFLVNHPTAISGSIDLNIRPDGP